LIYKDIAANSAVVHSGFDWIYKDTAADAASLRAGFDRATKIARLTPLDMNDGF
jgi:hypothetical protein